MTILQNCVFDGSLFSDIMCHDAGETGLSYDAGSENPEGSTVPWCAPTADGHPSGLNGPTAQLAPLDRWITMQTYSGSLPGFVAGLEEGLNCTGENLGVGLSAAAVPCTLNSSFYRARFEAMASSSKRLGTNVSQISVWGKSAASSVTQIHRGINVLACLRTVYTALAVALRSWPLTHDPAPAMELSSQCWVVKL